MRLNTYAELFEGELDDVADRMNAAYLKAQTDSALTELGLVVQLETN